MMKRAPGRAERRAEAPPGRLRPRARSVSSGDAVQPRGDVDPLAGDDFAQHAANLTHWSPPRTLEPLAGGARCDRLERDVGSLAQRLSAKPAVMSSAPALSATTCGLGGRRLAAQQRIEARGIFRRRTTVEHRSSGIRARPASLGREGKAFDRAVLSAGRPRSRRAARSRRARRRGPPAPARTRAPPRCGPPARVSVGSATPEQLDRRARPG